MKKFTALFLALILTQQSFALKVSDGDRNERLKADFKYLYNDSRHDRLWGGGILIGGGVAIATIGIVTGLNSMDPYYRTYAPSTFGILGGVIAVAGGLILLFPRPEETQSKEFLDKEEKNAEQVRLKAEFGEQTLTRLANQGKIRRYVGGGISLGIGAAATIYYLASDKTVSINTIWLYEGILFLCIGVLPFLLRTPPESALAEYQDWKKNREAGTSSIHFDVAPYMYENAMGAQIRMTF